MPLKHEILYMCIQLIIFFISYSIILLRVHNDLYNIYSRRTILDFLSQG